MQLKDHNSIHSPEEQNEKAHTFLTLTVFENAKYNLGKMLGDKFCKATELKSNVHRKLLEETYFSICERLRLNMVMNNHWRVE